MTDKSSLSSLDMVAKFALYVRSSLLSCTKHSCSAWRISASRTWWWTRRWSRKRFGRGQHGNGSARQLFAAMRAPQTTRRELWLAAVELQASPSQALPSASRPSPGSALPCRHTLPLEPSMAQETLVNTGRPPKPYAQPRWDGVQGPRALV
ncbi:hypothetical protein BCR44DRAFT_1437805, partial [Catenaria anguillulae PL171]